MFCVAACCAVEAPAWQLDQREEEEEADEGQQRSKGATHWLRALHERPAGAATGRATRRALPRDYQDVGQRVEQVGSRGEAGEPATARGRCTQQGVVIGSTNVRKKNKVVSSVFWIRHCWLVVIRPEI